ncbi:hypothetical protein [Promicromonospora sp. NPDC060271]|uniref:hypothetical protein n=1 Tax=Promicromonospora sp. NPDC060271 TaxID=3347089 RepID=UPI00364F8ADD
MTRTSDPTPRTPDGPPASSSFGVDGAALRPPDVRAMRERLAGMILPGASDTAGWVDLLGELEALKNTATAAQARLAVALESRRRRPRPNEGHVPTGEAAPCRTR